MEQMLAGAWDCHFHTAPDVAERKYTDLELADEWRRNGMRGGVIKAHYADTTGRAAMVRALYPGLYAAGGLVLNRQAGGINPDAAERMAQAGGEYLWFPTLDSAAYQCAARGAGFKPGDSPFLSVMDGDGKLIPAVFDVLDVAAKYDLVVGTGHLGEAEGLPLVREAFRRGVKKVVLTHAENPKTRFSLDAQRECVRLGAVAEYSFLMVYLKCVTPASIAAEIGTLGPENCLMVTDFGQPSSPGSAEGMAMFARELLASGISPRALETMMKETPLRLFPGVVS